MKQAFLKGLSMDLVQNGFSCTYDMEIFMNLFFEKNEDVIILTNLEDKENVINAYTEIMYRGKTYFEDCYFSFTGNRNDPKAVKKNYLCSVTKSFCRAAKQIRNVSLPWGVMSGIRPAKVVRQYFESGYSYDEIKEILMTLYEVTKEKAELAIKVAKNERRILSEIGKNSVSIYIGIPFCPTRCLYCSFVSTDIRKSGKYTDEFTRLLVKEIEKTAEVLKECSLYAENIYIGGGTPTTLSADQLAVIFKALKENITDERIKEFTLEAGRPDTITEEKLVLAKKYGVNRISINPQTMNDSTLKKIGRKHSPQMIREAFETARKCGFDNINMDLIAGLPDETPEMFKYSLDEVIKMNPENITVHSMCIKKAAALRFSEIELTKSREMNEMLDYAAQAMKKTDREPYYMYRQKNMSGNLENVGYAGINNMSFYNINIMEEAQTIIALGGGAATKIVKGDRIERIFNFKDPYEYISRFDEIIEKKNQTAALLKQ